MNIINRTPHPITIRTPGGDLTFEPSGVVARVATKEYEIGTLEGVPVIHRTFGDVEGLDDRQSDTAYIVSSIVLEEARSQGIFGNLFAPDSGPTAIRDEKGSIVAVTRLVGA